MSIHWLSQRQMQSFVYSTNNCTYVEALLIKQRYQWCIHGNALREKMKYQHIIVYYVLQW